jgi:3-hydroxyisobutyrate dehydrogenase-like beta-hydroxyacid dehydrogenase
MKVAVIGAGLMGSAIADAVLNAGHDAVVFDRNPPKLETLLARGAKAAGSVTEAILATELVILVLPDARCVQEALFGEDATATALRGKRVLNASTTNALEIAEIALRIEENGGRLAEISIMVGPKEVRDKQAFYLLGCSEEDQEFWSGFILSIGQSLYRVGEVGDASKAEAPIVIASTFGILGAAYAASVALKLGLPSELTDGYAGFLMPGTEPLLSKMLSRNYENAYASVNSLIGVAKAAEGSAKALGFPSRIFEEAGNIFKDAAARGFGSMDGASIVEVILDPDSQQA